MNAEEKIEPVLPTVQDTGNRHFFIFGDAIENQIGSYHEVSIAAGNQKAVIRPKCRANIWGCR